MCVRVCACVCARAFMCVRVCVCVSRLDATFSATIPKQRAFRSRPCRREVEHLMPSLGTAASKAGFLEPDLIYGSLDPFPMPPVLSGSPQSLRSTWYPMGPFWSPAPIMCAPLKLGNDFAKGRYSASSFKNLHLANLPTKSFAGYRQL